ncbi:hypothetical protein TNCV_1765311 [Trichonephila clavipes]|nr:hypothetical protein TNCV_1765311 [Trichonephila clavipes]
MGGAKNMLKIETADPKAKLEMVKSLETDLAGLEKQREKSHGYGFNSETWEGSYQPKELHKPILLLPVLNKLVEKMILNRLNDHLDKNNILIPPQHGF